MSPQKRRYRPRLNSIGVRLPAGIMLCVCTLIVLLVYAATTSQRFLKESIAQGMVLVTRELLTRVNQDLFLRVETTQMQARDSQVLRLLAESNHQFDEAADAQVLLEQRDREWRAGLASRPSAFMQGLTANPVSGGWREKFVDFHVVKYGFAVVEEIFLTNRYGAVVAQTRIASRYRHDDQAWWQTARQEGLYLSDSENERGAGTYKIGICLRVDDQSGRFAGVLHARVNISATIRSAAVAVRRHHTATVSMYTGDGKTIYSTRPFRLLEDTGDSPHFKRMVGSEGHFTARKGTRAVLFSYAKSDTFHNLTWPRWVLVMEHDVREIAIASIRLNGRMTAASLILVAMSLLIAYFLSRSILAPLSVLSRAVEKAGEGDLQPRIRIERNDEIGELAQAFTVMIRKRHEAESALAAEKEFSESIIETANALVVTLSAEGTIVSFNHFAERITGYSRSEVIGENWFKVFIEPSHREELRSAQTKMLSSPAGVNSRVDPIRAKSGDVLIIDWANSVLSSSQSGGAATLSIGIDLTDRSRAENALYEAEAKYRSAMESMPDLVYICSPDLRVEYMNRAMIDWIGRDATGEPCHQAIHGRDSRCPDCTWSKIAPGRSFETEFISPEDKRSFSVTHTPIVHQDGSVSKMTVYRDTTTIKKIESQLRQAQKMESLGTLAGGIAHDFNNILAPILGYSEVLLETAPQGSEAREGLSAILQAALRARDLVQQILTFSRRRSYELKPIRIQTVIAEALKLARSSLPSTIAIQQNIDPDCRLVMADATQIHQIVMNLITNAYHAMEETGGVLTVKLKQQRLSAEESAHMDLRPGTYVCLTVADTGIGMDQHVQDSLFDPYFTTKGEGKGTGLGLAVAHGIVKSHGGRISVYSQVGKGAEFHVYLPTIQAQPSPEDSAAFPLLLPGSESILLVDDQEEVLSTEQAMLERLGYRVTSCTGSAEALETFRASPEEYDLVITDLTMPGMTGDRLAGEVMKIRRDVPVVLCSGFGERLDREALASLGIRLCLTKPVSLNDLSVNIRNTLDRER